MNQKSNTILEKILKTNVSKRSIGALIESPLPFIDHIAPLCSIMDIPLISHVPEVKFKYESFYPGLKCKIKAWDLEYLLANYSHVLYPFSLETSFKKIQEKMQKEQPSNPIWKKNTKFVYHLHGCSDKGYHSKILRPNSHFKGLDTLLVYGNRMIDLLRDSSVLEVINSYKVVGNYRLAYYLEHKAFYDNLVQREILSKFKEKQPIIFYAPSWKDPENSTSFFDCYLKILEQLPQDMNLIIKLHPYMSIETDGYDPSNFFSLMKKYKEQPNVIVLQEFPLIYPLLNISDIYLGDFSSIGYDALSFNIPLFFINHVNRKKNDKGAYLLRCGTNIYPPDFDNIFNIITRTYHKNALQYKSVRSETYFYAFGQNLNYRGTQKLIKDIFT